MRMQLHQFVDASIFAASFWLAYELRASTFFIEVFNRPVIPPFETFFWHYLFLIPISPLVLEAQGFYDTGRFSLAKKRAEQILAADPNNLAARKFEEKVDRALSDYGVAAYNETRADAIAKTDMATMNGVATGVDALRNRLHWHPAAVGEPVTPFASAAD